MVEANTVYDFKSLLLEEIPSLLFLAKVRLKSCHHVILRGEPHLDEVQDDLEVEEDNALKDFLESGGSQSEVKNDSSDHH